MIELDLFCGGVFVVLVFMRFTRGTWSVCVWFISLIWSNGDLCFDGLLLFMLLQVRIQLGQGSAGSVTKNMLKNEGIGAFYKVWLYKNLLCVLII